MVTCCAVQLLPHEHDTNRAVSQTASHTSTHILACYQETSSSRWATPGLPGMESHVLSPYSWVDCIITTDLTFTWDHEGAAKFKRYTPASSACAKSAPHFDCATSPIPLCLTGSHGTDFSSAVVLDPAHSVRNGHVGACFVLTLPRVRNQSEVPCAKRKG